MTALALSPDGKLLASGQRGAPGSSSPVLLWLLDASGGGSVAARLVQHKGALQATAFSRDGGLLATLGGADDGLLAVWDVQTALALGCSSPVRPLCSAIAGEAAALALCWTRGSVSTGSERGIRQLITSGQRHVRAWFIDKDARRLKAESWVMGAASQRVVTCLALDDDDKRLFAGTTSGDVLEFNVHEGTFVRASPQALAGGVRSLAFFRMGGTCEVRGRDGSKAVSSGDGGGSIGGSDACLLAGSGEGALARLSVGGKIVLKPLSVTALAELEGSVTSISPSCSNDVDILADCGGSGKGGGELTILVGTAASATYELRLPAMTTRLLSTAHAAPVAAVTFACSPALLLTAGADSVRLWNVRAPPVAAELLRVVVADGGAAALCVAIDCAGSTVLSGWSDGQLRAHGPQSGRLMFAAENAHAGGVTAVAFTHDGARALSGGRDGRVRVWAATARDGAAVGDMLLSLKEHKKEVSALVVSADDAQAITASADGSCLFWSLARGARLRAVFANTSIRALAITPDASLLLTAGIDCRVTYWDVATTKAIRVMDGFTNEVRLSAHPAPRPTPLANALPPCPRPPTPH